MINDVEFDNWNEVKKTTNNEKVLVGFKQRDIFNVKIGKNIGFEQNGKGKDFVRPVLIYKKLSKDMFIGIPLTKTTRNGSFFYSFIFTNDIVSTAILAQIKLYSSKRLLNKVGKIDNDNFQQLKKKLIKLLD